MTEYFSLNYSLFPMENIYRTSWNSQKMEFYLYIDFLALCKYNLVKKLHDRVLAKFQNLPKQSHDSIHKIFRLEIVLQNIYLVLYYIYLKRNVFYWKFLKIKSQFWTLFKIDIHITIYGAITAIYKSYSNYCKPPKKFLLLLSSKNYNEDKTLIFVILS